MNIRPEIGKQQCVELMNIDLHVNDLPSVCWIHKTTKPNHKTMQSDYFHNLKASRLRPKTEINEISQ